MNYETIKMSDPELYGAMKKELEAIDFFSRCNRF